MELSSARQKILVRRALALKPELVPKLLGELSLAEEDVRAMSRNPMLLGLLCEHLRFGNDFPSTPYEVFSRYVEHRFERDAERVKSRHGLNTDELRVWAERIAFAMTSDSALGLSPRRADLRSVLRHEYPRVSVARLDSALDALEYIKLGRNDGSSQASQLRQFTFSHRRFQEYFTTRVVIANPGRVSPQQLLTDARWRETAVVLLQTGTATDSSTLLAQAHGILQIAENELQANCHVSAGINWPAEILHVLGILQAGGSSRPETISNDTREIAGQILLRAFQIGDLLDRKFALEVSGVIPQKLLIALARSALASDSHWLNDVIYRQTAKLSNVPEDIRHWIRVSLLRWGLNGQLARNWHGVRAHLLRLNGCNDLLDAALLARSIRTIDAVGVACCALVLACLALRDSFTYTRILVVIVISLVLAASSILTWKVYLWFGKELLYVRAFIFWLSSTVTQQLGVELGFYT